MQKKDLLMQVISQVILQVKQILLVFFSVFLVSFVCEARKSVSGRLKPSELRAKIKSAQKGEDEVANRVAIARHYTAVRKPQMVIEYLRPVAERLHVSGLRLLAKAYGAKKDHLQVVRILTFLVSQNPNDYVSYTRLAQGYAHIKKFDKATESFNKAISINRRYRPAYDGLLDVLEKTENKYDKRETLADMLKIFGNEPEILDKVCRAYYLDGYLDGAREVCQKAISRSPAMADNHVFLGLTYEASGNLPRALTIVQRAAKQFVKSEISQYTAGFLHEGNSNYLAAYKFFKRGVEADNTSARCWLGLANSAFLMKRYQESLDAFKEACKIKPVDSVQDFRSAASTLKSEQNFKWKDKFASESLRCRYAKSSVD